MSQSTLNGIMYVDSLLALADHWGAVLEASGTWSRVQPRLLTAASSAFLLSGNILSSRFASSIIPSYPAFGDCHPVS